MVVIVFHEKKNGKKFRKKALLLDSIYIKFANETKRKTKLQLIKYNVIVSNKLLKKRKKNKQKEYKENKNLKNKTNKNTTPQSTIINIHTGEKSSRK